MKTFVINLNERVDRMKHVDEQCKRLGIEYERFSAINGKELNLDELDSSLVSERGKLFAKGGGKRKWGLTLTPGAIGCALSHKFIWELSALEGVIVLEDDINIMEDFKQRIDEVMKEIPQDWDLCYLGSHIKQKLLDEAKKPFFVPRGQVNGTIGYMISPKGIKKIREKCFPLSENQIDTTLYSNFKKWQVYHLNPVVVKMRKSKSDVQW